MSNALAIAAATSTLQQLLLTGIPGRDPDLPGLTVTTLPLDTARPPNGDGGLQLNLFLYQTVLNAASGIPGFDVARLKNALNSSAVTSLANRYTSEANADKVNGTPTVYVAKGSGPRVQVAPGLIPSADQLSAAIDKALGQ